MGTSKFPFSSWVCAHTLLATRAMNSANNLRSLFQTMLCWSSGQPHINDSFSKNYASLVINAVNQYNTQVCFIIPKVYISANNKTIFFKFDFVNKF